MVDDGGDDIAVAVMAVLLLSGAGIMNIFVCQTIVFQGHVLMFVCPQAYVAKRVRAIYIFAIWPTVRIAGQTELTDDD